MAGSSVENRNAVRRFFRPDGLLSTRHPAFEPRKGQSDMAAAVEEALSENRKLIVEAGISFFVNRHALQAVEVQPLLGELLDE